MADKVEALETENQKLRDELKQTKEKLAKELSDAKAVKLEMPSAGERTQMIELMQKIDNAEIEKEIVKVIKQLSAGEATDEVLARAINDYSQEAGAVVPPRNLAMANKITAKIPKYGISPSYQWEQLVAHLQMTQKRSVYTEEEMKMILQDSLEGPAFEYIQANQQIFEATYADALEALSDVFGRTRAQAMNDLQGITQQPKETVELFAARLLNAADVLKPPIPSIMHVVMRNGKRTFEQNPNYRTEHAAYRGQLQMLDGMYVTYLINGLRTEIRRQMRAEEYATFAEARKAARTAERFLNHLATPSMVAGVGVIPTPTQVMMAQATAIRNEGLETNAAYLADGRSQLKKMEGFKKKDYSKVRCFRCGQYGHMAAQCNARVRVESPYRPAGGNQGSTESTSGGVVMRSNSPRSGSPARGQSGRVLKGARVVFGGDTKPRGRSPTRNMRGFNKDCTNCQRLGKPCSYHARRRSGSSGSPRKFTPPRQSRRVYYINDDGTVEDATDESKNE